MRMKGLTHNSEIDLIPIKSISRFGRSTVGMLRTLLNLCDCKVCILLSKRTSGFTTVRFKFC